MNAIRTILHPTDFSVCSQEAFELAGMLARSVGARLIVVHVVPQAVQVLGPQSGIPARAADAMEADLQDYKREMKEKLHELQDRRHQIALEHALCEGDAAAEILRTARNRDCDLIVLGTHGRSGLAHVLLGSVAEEVARNAPCPTVMVRVPEERQ